jgi:hypothetical protein
MSEINSKPPTMDGKGTGTGAGCFVRYMTTTENIVVQMTYPGSWSISPTGPQNGYNATAIVVGGAYTTITFDFTVAVYTETAQYTFTVADGSSGPWLVTMGAPA